jgi:hypothetical protein
MGFSDPETAAAILLSRSIDYRRIQDAWPFPSDGLLRMDYGIPNHETDTDERGPFGRAGMGQVREILPLHDTDTFQPSNSLVSERATSFRGDGSDGGQRGRYFRLLSKERHVQGAATLSGPGKIEKRGFGCRIGCS